MRIQDSITVATERRRAWELLADPAHYPRVLSWVTSFEPEDDEVHPGLGARYRVRLHVGSTEVGGLVEVIEYDEERDLLDQRHRDRAAGPDPAARCRPGLGQADAADVL